MKDPEKYLEYLHNQLEIIELQKTRKEEEIREHINRYDLNKRKDSEN